jgi:hypothetical protein
VVEEEFFWRGFISPVEALTVDLGVFLEVV